MGTGVLPLGLGLGWRHELALMIDCHRDLEFVEFLAEDLAAWAPFRAPIERLIARGVTVMPHGVTLSLEGAEPLDLFCRRGPERRCPVRNLVSGVSQHADHFENAVAGEKEVPR